MVKGEQTRKQLLDTAMKLFSEKGYSDVKMKDITDALGVQPSWISYYFKNKSNLIEEIYRRGERWYQEKIKEVYDGDDVLIIRFLYNYLVYATIEQDPEALRYRYELAKERQTTDFRQLHTVALIKKMISYYNLPRLSTDEMLLISRRYIPHVNDMFICFYERQCQSTKLIDVGYIPLRCLAASLGVDLETIEEKRKIARELLDKINIDEYHVLR